MTEHHKHTGLDSSRIEFENLESKKAYVSHSLPGTMPATAANYEVFWIAPFAGYVSEFREVHRVAGTDAGSVTLQLEKLTGTQALDAGTNVLATALDLKATANTVQTATLSNTLSARQFARGDRFALKDSGTLTAVAGLSVVLEVTY
jgi:hypothetical protein